jgi:hypothetical protein
MLLIEEQAQSYGIMASTARTTAAGEEQIANETKSAGTLAAVGDVAGAIFKGAAAVAGLATGGASDVVGYAATSAIGDPTGLSGLY